MRPIQNLQPCKDCDRIRLLYEHDELCPNGYCNFTNSLQPLDEPWYCEHFRINGRRLHPRLAHLYTKKKTRRKKKRGAPKTT